MSYEGYSQLAHIGTVDNPICGTMNHDSSEAYSAQYYAQLLADPAYALYAAQYYPTEIPNSVVPNQTVNLDTVILKTENNVNRGKQNPPDAGKHKRKLAEEDVTVSKGVNQSRVKGSGCTKEESNPNSATHTAGPSRKKIAVREAAGKVWIDKSLEEWPESKKDARKQMLQLNYLPLTVVS
jgi:hypothetical protein